MHSNHFAGIPRASLAVVDFSNVKQKKAVMYLLNRMIRFCSVLLVLMLAITAFGCSRKTAISESFPYDLKRAGAVELDFKRVNGAQAVGIVCSRELFSELRRRMDVNPMRVLLTDSEDPSARVVQNPLGTRGTVGDSIPDWHYLFTISSTARTKVSLLLPTIDVLPPNASSTVQIVMAKSPAQMNEPLW